MKFNDTNNTHDSLTHYVNFVLGGITNDDFSLADKARGTNTAKYLLGLKVLRNADGWDFDDTAYTDFAIATTDLEEGVRDYLLPTKLLSIRKVRVKDLSGDWLPLSPIDERNYHQPLEELFEDPAVPLYYRIVARSLFLYPSPTSNSVTLSSGLKIEYDRELNEFDSATTTTEIGIGEPGDRVVALNVAEEWARFYRPERLEAIQQQRIELENEFMYLISHRMKQEAPRMMPRVENYE